MSVFESDQVDLKQNISLFNMQVIAKYNNHLGDVVLENAAQSGITHNYILQDLLLPSKAVSILCYDSHSIGNRVENNHLLGDTLTCGEYLWQNNQLMFENAKKNKDAHQQQKELKQVLNALISKIEQGKLGNNSIINTQEIKTFQTKINNK